MLKTNELYTLLDYIDKGVVAPTITTMRDFAKIQEFYVRSNGKVPESASLLTSVEKIEFSMKYGGDFSCLSMFPKVKIVKCNCGAAADYIRCGRHKKLFNALESLPLIEEIDLSYNQCFYSLDGFPRLPSLKRLDINGNILSDMSPLSGLELQELNISRCSFSDLAFDGSERIIKKLSASRCPLEGTERTYRTLLMSENMEELDLTGTYIENFDFVQKMPKLRKLSIGPDVVSLRPLRHLRKLRDLVVCSKYPFLLEVGVLKNLPDLQSVTINLPHNERLKAPLNDLMDTNVEELTLNGLFTKNDLLFVYDMPNLKRLSVNGMTVVITNRMV